MSYHNPVLLMPSVDGLDIEPHGVYVDVTFGGGGHSSEILRRLGSNGKLFAFDQDEDALANAIDDSRFTLIHQNFRYLRRFLRFYNITAVDGILADLGVSSHQFDVAARGFSTRFEGGLDMRMSRQNERSAYHVVNDYEELELRRVLSEFGELKNAPVLARLIVEARQKHPLKNTDDLKRVLLKTAPPHKINKVLAQVYQAIRIEVNEEIEVLKDFLQQALDVLKPGGRLSVISYHSLEDRLVKRFLKNGMFEGEPERDVYGHFSVPFKAVEKLIVPTEQEIERNSRARSAKLRIAEKL